MALNVGAVVAQFKSDISGMQQGIASVKSQVGKLKTSFSDVGAEMAGAGAALVRFGTIGAAAMGALGLGAVKTAANLEQQRMAFKTLLGSVEKADEALTMIKKDAANTPFELVGLIEANKLLTAVTKDAPRSEKMLLNVGKSLAAVGKGQAELDRIIVNLQQIGAVGKASMVDIKQFAFAGIPIFEMLTETTGKSGAALEDLISGGGVTFDVLEKMFAKYGSEGGRFADAFANQAGTANQSWSNLMDTLTVVGAEFAQQTGLFDAVKNAIKGVTDWILQNKDGIIAWVNETKTQIATFVAAVAEFFAPVIEWLKKFFSEVENRKAFIFAVLVGLAVLIGAAAIAFIAAHAVFIAVVAGIMFIAGALYKYWDDIWGGIQAIVSGTIEWIKGAWEGMKNWFLGIGDAIGEAIVKPFRWAKEQIEKIAQSIKDAADKINPFHRESPSLVDNVQSGVGKIVDEYKGMVSALSGMSLRDSIMQFSPAVAGSGAGGNTVNQNVYANVGDGLDVDTLAERLAFKYRSEF